MRKPFVIGLSVLSVVLGSATNVWAVCSNQVEQDFVGLICPGTPGTNGEMRTGRWINDDGGVFEGTVTVLDNPDGSQIVQKQGTLRTPRYVGALTHTESRSVTGAKSSESKLIGKEALPDGVLDGTTTLTINQDVSQQMSTNGALHSSTFDGTYFRNETRSIAGTMVGQQLVGREVLAGGGTFLGTTTLVINVDGSQRMDKNGDIRSATFDGTYIRTDTRSVTGAKTVSEQYTGTWTLSPTLKSSGSYTIIINPDGSVSKTDTRR